MSISFREYPEEEEAEPSKTTRRLVVVLSSLKRSDAANKICLVSGSQMVPEAYD